MTTISHTSFDYNDVDGTFRHQGVVLQSTIEHLRIRKSDGTVKSFERSRISNMRSTVEFAPNKARIRLFLGDEEEGFI